MWLGKIAAVASNQKRARPLSTWPLNGMVPSTTSKALTRSVTRIEALAAAREVLADLAAVARAEDIEIVRQRVEGAARRQRAPHLGGTWSR